MRLNGPQTDTYHHKSYIDTVLNNDQDDGEMILKPEGWFNGLAMRDQSNHALTVNQLNMGHEDNVALPEDERAWVLSRAKFLDGSSDFKVLLKRSFFILFYLLNL